MELVHDFTVPVPADQAWELLVDVEKIAPCLPGAAVTSVDGDTFEGGMKIKLGPISMTFKGDGALVEKDAAARRAVIKARAGTPRATAARRPPSPPPWRSATGPPTSTWSPTSTSPARPPSSAAAS